MNRRYVGLVIAEAVIIMLLLVGVAVMFVLLNSTAPLPSLPAVPTYNPVFSTSTPIPVVSLAPSVSTPTPSITPTKAGISFFVLNGTPTYLTPLNTSYSVRTSTPIPASTPISVTVWTYTPTPYSTTPQAQTCKNILYPMTTGRQWVYQANTPNRTDILNMSVLSVNNSQGNVLIKNQSTGTTKQVQIQCIGDIIRSFPFMSMDVLFGNSLNSSVSASYVSGVLAPNETAFLNNNWALAWSSQYLVSGTTAVNRNGTQLSVTLNNSPVTLSCQTLASGEAAFENITVAAGTFRALKVVCSEAAQVTTNFNGVQVTGMAEGRSYQWFAPYVGLVKMQVDYAVVKIFDISFSLLTNNNLELKSYIATP
jgi:hypothetical protein